MKLLFLLFIAYTIAEYQSALLNEFTADVDIYDMGRMGRGKNAASWNRSPTHKQEVFYYVAMQPWRHLVWTAYENNMWVKYFINEDASSIPSETSTKKLQQTSDQDYCRKEYATPMDTYDIDWTQVDPEGRLESVDINGMTCYKYPAKLPLANIYLLQHYTRDRDVTAMTPCRYDFVGGKSITFRSFNTFSEVFIGDTQPNGYLGNKTKCKIDPSPNNVDTDLAIILGISDATFFKDLNAKLEVLKSLSTIKNKKVYYSTGESVKAEEFTDWKTLGLKSVAQGSVDAIITMAKDDLVKRIKNGQAKKGTIIVLMDTPLTTSFDAETAFDRNSITVHTVLYNPNDDNQMTRKARTLLSLGEYHHEFTAKDTAAMTKVMNELFVGVRANLTERCDRTTCNGFCDGRDRCTCPMCCENTCFFSYCETSTATCKPWPPAKPKAKIVCKDDCVGKQECRDLEGCVYKEYNPGCKPTAKCMKPSCETDAKNPAKQVCVQKSACEADKTPSYNNRCWSYTCNEATGNCERDQAGAECPRLPSLCHEYACDADLKCITKERVCVKTSPYIEMPCYEGRCNRKTGKCENALKCNTYTTCGTKFDKNACGCDSTDGKFDCKCEGSLEGYCSENEVCDSTGVYENNPTCVESVCGEDLYRQGCMIKKCDNTTKQTYMEEMDCSEKVKFTFKSNNTEVTVAQVEKYCKDKYGPYCYDGECFGEMKTGETEAAGCGECYLHEKYTVDKDGNKTYTVSYDEKCKYSKPRCADGTTPDNYNMFGDSAVAECVQEKGEYKCKYPALTPEQGYQFCAQCYSHLECYKANEYRNYVYNQETGTCSMSTIKTKERCTKCNAAGNNYESTCPEGSEVENTYTYQNGGKQKTFKYYIPKQCAAEQCIPVPSYDCMSRSGNVSEIVNALLKCAPPGAVTGTYHYSSLFDRKKYENMEAQSEAFMAEADAQAYCEWTVVEENCNYCGFNSNGEMTTIDKCDLLKEEMGLGDAITFSCVGNNECKIDEFACEPQNCWYFKPDTQTGNCVNASKSSCEIPMKNTQDKINLWKQDEHKGEANIVCDPVNTCDTTDHTCPVSYTNDKCEQAYNDYIGNNKDFGCRIPNKVCDESTYHCTFTVMTHPDNDTSFFRIRDGVVSGHACYNYTCIETIVDGVAVEHHWKLSEASQIEISIGPDHLCETTYCDDVKGYTIHKPKLCTPQEAFKMTETQAECFECKCSFIDGEPQIVMRSNTNERTYELDACGNCIVRNKAGEQVNDPVECILSATVNLTGAIAGATVAASVVFGLIGSMVVVSIGAFQTYQLVSSAMKNVIATTLENPEFVAADNEATNVLANGD